MYNNKDLNLCGANRDAEIRSPKASNNMPWQVKFENHLPACLPGEQCFFFFFVLLLLLLMTYFGRVVLLAQ